MESEKKQLNIKTVPVEIRVLLVDGKRMTKAVFNQITLDSGEGKDGVVRISEDGRKFGVNHNVLGWVFSGIEGDSQGQHKFLIYSKDGVMYRIWEEDFRSWLIRATWDLEKDAMEDARSLIRSNLFSGENQIYISI